jgi:hypothetical protein
MNTGQMLLTLGALILLSTLTLRVNTTQLSTQDTMQNSKFGVLAVSVASSIMEEASEKAFDEISVGNFIDDTKSLSKRDKSGFKIDPGENPDNSNTFDDFDDFDGYSKIDSTMPSAIFNVSCIVNYVDPDEKDFITTKNTWHKQLIIKVTSPSMADSIEMTKIFSYWKFPS